MHSTQRVSFHESSLVGWRHLGGTLTLELEGAYVGGDIRNVSLRLEAVSTVLRDGVAVESFTSEFQDGEVLTLEYTETSLHVIVEWTDFKSHQSQTHSYRIACESISVEIH
jgi:hypothetical protein